MSLAHLQWCFSIEFELGHLLTPWQPLPGLVVQEVVKDGPLRGELDVLELCHPPLGELHTVVYQLYAGRGWREGKEVWLGWVEGGKIGAVIDM